MGVCTVFLPVHGSDVVPSFASCVFRVANTLVLISASDWIGAGVNSIGLDRSGRFCCCCGVFNR